MIPPPDIPDNAALFLDFDGTLIDFADTPDGVTVPDTLVPLLARIQRRLDGALAILSGRTLGELDGFLAGLTFPGAGNHGRDMRWPDGSLEPSVIPNIDAEMVSIERFAADDPGLLIERKHGAVALHYRKAPARQSDVEAFMATLADDREDLVVMPHKMLVELKDAHSNKGAALRAQMERAPFTGRTPIFVGDDLNDEPGMEAAQDLGGFAIKVGEGPSVARYRLPDVQSVHRWLETAAE